MFSPEYDCQSALQVKLHACMNAKCQEQLGKCCGFNGSHCWVMKMATSAAKPTMANINTAQK